ncbi:MAG: hypothetical protein QM757_38300 [Paludibaculum sp.]
MKYRKLRRSSNSGPNDADRILFECRIVSRLDPNVGRVLEFADAIRRTQVLQTLQNDHSFYLQAKFNAICRRLFFDGSEAIAGHVTKLTAEMMASDTGTYTAHWLLALRQGPVAGQAFRSRVSPGCFDFCSRPAPRAGRQQLSSTC